MSCCGQKRQALRAPAYETTARRLPPTLQNPRSITYVAGSAFVVKGAATGLTYLFTQGEALDVDERDVPALVAAGVFIEMRGLRDGSAGLQD